MVVSYEDIFINSLPSYHPEDSDTIRDEEVEIMKKPAEMEKLCKMLPSGYGVAIPLVNS